MNNFVERINTEGFILDKIELKEDLFNQVMSSKEPTEEVKSYCLNLIKKYDPDVQSVYCAYEDLVKGDTIEMHSHLLPARYQALIWFPSGEYKGRDFLYGTPDNIKRLHPTYGDICFMKTNDTNSIHGVSTLESETFIRTLVISVDRKGLLGEHLTVSAHGLRVIP